MADILPVFLSAIASFGMITLPIVHSNYHDFFLRPEGGAWIEDKEIHSFIDTSSATFLHDYIMMEIEFQKIEYFMIVFCGHGYVNANNDTALCMKDGMMSNEGSILIG